MSDRFKSGIMYLLEQIQRHIEYVHNEQGDYYPIMILLSIFKMIFLAGCLTCLIIICICLKRNFGM